LETLSLADHVRHGHEQGWSFTPLDGKRPINKAWPSAPRETLEQVLAWAARGNVGLRTGQTSGVVVIDVDPGANIEPLNLPGTVVALTGRPGAFHLYFRHTGPLGNSSSKLGPHLDVKADGGQVVFPGSVHPETGTIYTWLEGHEPWAVELADLPDHIVALLTAPDRPKPPVARSSSDRTIKASDAPGHRLVPAIDPDDPVEAKAVRYAQRTIQLELHAIHTAVEGQRNELLNKAAFSLGRLIGGGYLTRAEVEAALRGAAESIGLEPHEIDTTLRSGIDSGIAQPRTIVFKPPIKPADPRDEYILLPGPHKDDNDKFIERSASEFTDEVLTRLPAGAIYRRDFIPGEIIGSPGKRRWLELVVDRMRLVSDRNVKLGKWVTSRQTGEQVLLYQSCAKDAGSLLLAHAQKAKHLRELHMMVSYPIYGLGFVRINPGWHDGLYFDEPETLRGLVPETDREIIHTVLHDLVVDFPFKTQADRENFFGLLLTPIVAPAIDGNRPMHLLNAPLERTGKSKLVNEVFGGVITGRDTPSMQITEREEEREKRILSTLLQGETLMHLDNLPGYIDSPALASLLTTQWFVGRLLGYSRNISLLNNLTIVGTGNNVQSSGEIAKRIVPILLEPTSSRPEARTDFQHPDIRAYVRQQRRTVLECLLGMVENWIAAGKPKHANRLGGFESWSETIGGILEVNGLHAWRTNEGNWRKSANPRGSEMETFVEIWHEAFGVSEVPPKELIDLAERHNLFAFVFARNGIAARGSAFGKMLTRYLDAPVGEWRIRQRTSRHAVYRLEAVCGA